MIKLFWNTHNQKKFDAKDKEIKEKHDRDYVWGVYHKKSSNLWIYEILKKIKYNIIENENDLEKSEDKIVRQFITGDSTLV